MVSRLSQMQARFQQKQMQEKEEKLVRLYENQQQRTIERVNRGSAGSNTSVSSLSSVTSTQGGKVRQMFDERRQKAGIDRSYPLEPLRKVSNRTVVNKTTLRSKNGKPTVNKREVVQTLYNNNNGDEYFEERRYEDDNANSPSNYGRILNKTYRPRDLEILMRNHNIHDTLDNEEFPDLGIDDIDDSNNESMNSVGTSPLQNGSVKHAKSHVSPLMNENSSPVICSISPQRDAKFPDLGIDEIYASHIESRNSVGSSPHHNGIANHAKSRKAPLMNGNAAPVKSSFSPKKEVKATVLKTVVRAVSPQLSPPSSASSNKIVVSPARTPEKFSIEKMSSRTSAKPSQQRTPSSTRSGKGSAGASASVVSRDNLVACRYCSRRFANDRIAKHEDICAKTAKKKRRAYDATKHRIQGTELEPYARKISKISTNKIEPPAIALQKQQGSKEKPPPVKKTDWRRKHEEFISAIRSAKMAQAHVAKGGKLSDLPPPPPSSNPDYIQCPHCGRRFNEAAGARHIPKCASYDFNKPKPQTRPGGGAGPGRGPPKHAFK